ncbi:MAG: hypothetical protein QNK03_00360 [Myxococcota bacterium]|nr:hypothetical protein [Myxococcota bacterium]
MRRWVALVLGAVIAAAALYALAGLAPGPTAEIDDASRAQLERVLREADGAQP